MSLGTTGGRATRTAVDDVGTTPRLSTVIRPDVTGLWEAGDEHGTRKRTVTCGNRGTSTIHSTYCCPYLSIQERERETLP